MAGLRERKKQRTRDALIRAAHELFVAQGYEHTTVDEIAAEVNVSQRTFFRYFTNKEEVAFAIHEMVQERFFAAVLARPAHESPMTALRGALDDGWETIGEAIQEAVPLELHLRMWQVIETTPALVAVELRRSVELEERLALSIAERAGVDIDTDPRPRVLVAAFSAVMRVAMRRWGRGEDLSIPAVQRRTQEYLDQLGPALSSHWRVGAADDTGSADAADSTADTAGQQG